MKYPEPKFTADQLAGVFTGRWMARDVANRAISHIRDLHMNNILQKIVPRPIQVGEKIKFKVPR